MEGQFELYRSHHQLQEKYVFYIIALCVSAIGFSVYCTMGKPLQYSQIVLLIAVLSWGFSIYCGLNYIKNLLYATKGNFDRITSLNNIRQGYEPNPIYFLMLDINDKDVAENLTIYGKCQEYLFYTGIVAFIVWHILQMYLTI